MNKFFYAILKYIPNIHGIYFDFVNDKEININNNYIVYSIVSENPYYEYSYSTINYQIAVYSSTLEVSSNIRDNISKLFSYFGDRKKLINYLEINFEKEKVDEIDSLIRKSPIILCGCDIENHSSQYIYEDKLYQSITNIKILYKL